MKYVNAVCHKRDREIVLSIHSSELVFSDWEGQRTILLHWYTITYKSKLTPKKCTKKPDAIFSIHGKNGIMPWIFFLNSHLGLSRSLRSNDIWPLNFEAATSKFGNHSWTFGSSPQRGKVDLCMTNGSKVLIYLTLLHFIVYCTLVSNAIGDLAKSNKA